MAAGTQTESTQSSNDGGRRVLVVDDNADAAESIGTLLEIFGHSVQIAGDGEGALKRAREFQPEAIVLDIGLPGIDGYEVARRLRERPEMQNTIMLAVSGYGRPDDVKRALDAGFDHHLVKPADPDAIHHLLMSSRALPT
ncbi:MAG: response regulator [Betaproteobacteria bacterium]